VKDHVEQRTSQKYVVYKAVKFRQQLVAGRNFSIKVRNIVIYEEKSMKA